MLKMIQQSSFTGLSTIQELPAHIEYYKSCKMSLIYLQYTVILINVYETNQDLDMKKGF